MNSAVEKEIYLGKNPDKEREKRRERERERVLRNVFTPRARPKNSNFKKCGQEIKQRELKR